MNNNILNHNAQASMDTMINQFKLELSNQSPTINIDLPFKVNHNKHISSLHKKIKINSYDRSKDVQQDSTQLLMTERTINQLNIVNKEITKSSNIKSYLRIKPYKDCNYIPLDIYNNQTIIIDRSIYKFDSIFQPQTPQHKIYEIVGKEVTNNFIEGYNGTIFAYGSTGSGKTYTMFGHDDGIVPSVVEQIFSKLNLNCFKLSCSMIQIYKQNLIDLLCQNDLDLKIKQINNSLSIQNLSIHEIKNKQQTYSIIKKGNILKKIRETNLNQSSSRSHVVFTFYLENIHPDNRPIRCKFNLVDLAGSQKVCKSKVQGEGLEQAIKINLSLSCLGNTIHALVKNSEHIPYRQSKLTRILKESLMGNSITRLIVTCCITQQSMQQTVSSIKFAQRAQKIQTQAQISYNITKLKSNKEQNQKHIKSQLKSLSSQINSLKQLLKSETKCKNCLQMKDILQNTKIQHFHEQSIFNPIKALKSPQSKTNISNYFSTNSTSKYSSIARKDQSKNHTIKVNYLKQDNSQCKETINKKIYQLKIQNTKLKQSKNALQLRISQLQEKLKQKQSMKMEKGNKKIIRLNISEKYQNRNGNGNINGLQSHNGERASRGNPRDNHEDNKQNNGNAINIQRDSFKHTQTNANNRQVNSKPVKITKDEQECSLKGIIDNSSHGSDINGAIQLFGQIIHKLQQSTKEYRNIIFPFQIQILNNQISLLQQTIIQQKIIDMNHVDLSKSLRLVIQLQKKLCYYIDQIPLVIEKLFEVSAVSQEIKEELFDCLKNKTKQISDIKWSMKELYDESEELNELANLLQRSKNISFIKQKQKIESCNQSICSQNEFLMLSYANIQNLIKHN